VILTSYPSKNDNIEGMQPETLSTKGFQKKRATAAHDKFTQ